MSKDTVVLTASAGTFPGLAGALAEMSIQLEIRPLLSFEQPADWGQLDRAVKSCHSDIGDRRRGYQAVALTSPRAAQAFAERIDACGVTWDDTAPAVWVVGSTTEEALRGRVPVRKPNISPELGETAAASLARAMLEAGVRTRVLFPCGDRRRDELPALLHAHGIQVDEVVCYRSVLATRDEARAAVSGGTIVIVASPSVAALLAEACRGSPAPRLVAIGATTAETARAAGWLPVAVAVEPSTAAVASAITGLLATR
jgi:uroporphyrinogen-III synthase